MAPFGRSERGRKNAAGMKIRKRKLFFRIMDGFAVQLRRLGPVNAIERLLPTGDKVKWLAGRGSSCQIYTNSKFASRKHFAITLNDAQYFIADEGSANGTFLNNQKIVEQKALEVGNIISVGVPPEMQESAECIVYVFERCPDESAQKNGQINKETQLMEVSVNAETSETSNKENVDSNNASTAQTNEVNLNPQIHRDESPSKNQPEPISTNQSKTVEEVLIEEISEIDKRTENDFEIETNDSNDEVPAPAINKIITTLEEGSDSSEKEEENAGREIRKSTDQEDEDIFSSGTVEDEEAYNACTQIDEAEIKQELVPFTGTKFSVAEEVIEISDSEDEEWSQSVISQQLQRTNLNDSDEDSDDDVQFLEIVPSAHVLNHQIQIKKEPQEKNMEEEEEEDVSEIDIKWMTKLERSQEYHAFISSQQVEDDDIEIIDDLDEEEQDPSLDKPPPLIWKTRPETFEKPIELMEISSEEEAAEKELADIDASKSTSNDEDLAVPGPSGRRSPYLSTRRSPRLARLSPRRSPRRLSTDSSKPSSPRKTSEKSSGASPRPSSPQKADRSSAASPRPSSPRKADKSSAASPKPSSPQKITTEGSSSERSSSPEEDEDIFEPMEEDEEQVEPPKSPARPETPITDCYVKLNRIDPEKLREASQSPPICASPRSSRSPSRLLSPNRDKPDEDEVATVKKDSTKSTFPKPKRRIKSDGESETDSEGEYSAATMRKAKLISPDEAPAPPTKRRKMPLDAKINKQPAKYKQPLPTGNLSPSARAKQVRMRKERLKEIEERKERLRMENAEHEALNRPKVAPSSLKVKNTSKSRGDFLCEMGQQSTTTPTEAKKKVPPNPLLPRPSLSTPKYPPPEKVEPLKKPVAGNEKPGTSFEKALSSSDSALPERGQRRRSTNKLRFENKDLSARLGTSEVSSPDSTVSEKENLRQPAAENIRQQAAANSARTTVPRSILKGGAAFMRSYRPLHAKKKVEIDEKKNIVIPYVIEDETVRMRKLNLNPTPLTKEEIILQGETRYRNIILNICTWNTKWLEECKVVSEDEHPPMLFPPGETVKFVPKKFNNYKQYLKCYLPFLFLDLWANISNTWKLNGPHLLRCFVACSKYENGPLFDKPNENLNKGLSILHCEGILPGSENGAFTKEGDLVLVRITVSLTGQFSQSTLSQASQGSQRKSKLKIHNVFGFVLKRTTEKILPSTPIHMALVQKCSSISQENYLCKMQILMKKRPEIEIDTMNSILTLTTLDNIKSDLRLMKALCYLPKSPLCDTILSLNRPDLTMANPNRKNKIIFNKPLDMEQQSLVLKLAASIFKSAPTLHEIEGGPGTGKTYLMIALIMQILFGAEGKGSVRPKIIYCTQSNAAIDEVALSLLKYRQELDPSDRYRLVRVGPTKNMRVEVADALSSQKLALRNAKIEKTEKERKHIEVEINKLAEHLSAMPNSFSKTELEEKRNQINNLMRKRQSIEQGRYVSSVTEVPDEAEDLIIQKADIICTTAIYSGTNKMIRIFNRMKAQEKNQRIICIIDEALQCKESESVMPLMLGVTNLILVGDPFNLPPPIRSKKVHAFNGYNSLFYRVSRHFNKTKESLSPIVTLKTQYRMNPSIAEYPSRTFYNNRLKPGVNWANKLRTINLKPYVILVNNEEISEEKKRDEAEARIAEKLLKVISADLEKSKEENLTVAVITSHQKQANFIRGKVKEQYQKNVEINTIERFQGREFNVVIFLSDGTNIVTGRINLALTRAKDTLIVAVISKSPAKIGPHFKHLIANGSSRNVVRNVNEFVTEEELASVVTSNVFR